MTSSMRYDGLTGQASSTWPRVSPKQQQISVPDRIQGDTALNQRLAEHLRSRIKFSEDHMNRFYDRWRAAEKRMQAYVTLTDFEQMLKEMNDSGKAPRVISINLPYSYSTILTIVTYLMHTFWGRKPKFATGSYAQSGFENARAMETLLEYNAEHTRLVKKGFQWFLDGETYGVGVLRCMFKTQMGKRTVQQQQSNWGFYDRLLGTSTGRVRKPKLIYQGNEIDNVDPFHFLPDPRVPMTEVNRKGEWVFWKGYMGIHELKKQESAGRVFGVSRISTGQSRSWDGSSTDASARDLLSRGMGQPGNTNYSGRGESTAGVTAAVEYHQGTCEIIPAELGLGTSTKVEKWLFTLANKSTVIQAEPFEADHDMHPVAVIEPHTLGYGFGQPGMTDYIGPLQDVMSWFINSHMDNIKLALNNMWIVDPSRIELQDFKRPGPSKIIRLKKSAFGFDIREAIQQVQVTDVTRNHVQDLQGFMALADALSSVNDNLRGIQAAGGRKTATEVRTSGEAAASRLAAEARLISSQGFADLAEMMSLNLQQGLEMEFYLQVLGEEAAESAPSLIGPDQITGDFYFPIHDGTLPMDKVALLDAWKEIFLGVAQDQVLREEFDLPRIFEWTAELSGAKNISSFKKNVGMAPDNQVAQQAQAGNLVPLGQGRAAQGGPGLV